MFIFKNNFTFYVIYKFLNSPYFISNISFIKNFIYFFIYLIVYIKLINNFFFNRIDEDIDEMPINTLSDSSNKLIKLYKDYIINS